MGNSLGQRMTRLAYCLLITLWPSITFAETLSYVCKEATGRIIGLGSELDEHVDEPDRINGGLISIIWERGGKFADISFGAPLIGTPLSNQGILVQQTNEYVSFLVLYPRAVILYSLFLNSKILLMSQHTDGIGFDRPMAINKSFKARCELN